MRFLNSRVAYLEVSFMEILLQNLDTDNFNQRKRTFFSMNVCFYFRKEELDFKITEKIIDQEVPIIEKF